MWAAGMPVFQRSALDGGFEGVGEDSVDVDHREFLAAVRDHQSGCDHAGRIVSDRVDMGLRSPVQLRDADGRGDVGAGGAGEET